MHSDECLVFRRAATAAPWTGSHRHTRDGTLSLLDASALSINKRGEIWQSPNSRGFEGEQVNQHPENPLCLTVDKSQATSLSVMRAVGCVTRRTRGSSHAWGGTIDPGRGLPFRLETFCRLGLVTSPQETRVKETTIAMHPSEGLRSRSRILGSVFPRCFLRRLQGFRLTAVAWRPERRACQERVGFVRSGAPHAA